MALQINTYNYIYIFCIIKIFKFFSDNLLHDGGVSGPVSLPASRLTSATTSGPTGNSRKDLTSGSGGPGGGATSPPPPPPRGSNPAGAPPPTSGSSYTRSHARSSSLDLNNLQNRELHHKNNSSQILHQRPPTVCVSYLQIPQKSLKVHIIWLCPEKRLVFILISCIFLNFLNQVDMKTTVR